MRPSSIARLRRRPLWRAGFTLIQLLISVAVIAILTGVTLRRSAGAKRQAVKTRLAIDLQKLAATLESALDTQGKFAAAVPAFAATHGEYPNVRTSTGTEWSLSALGTDSRRGLLVVRDTKTANLWCGVGIGAYLQSSTYPFACADQCSSDPTAWNSCSLVGP